MPHMVRLVTIVTDYRLNANHNKVSLNKYFAVIVTDYRLNANHNFPVLDDISVGIVTDYRLNANHNCKQYKNKRNKL